MGRGGGLARIDGGAVAPVEDLRAGTETDGRPGEAENQPLGDAVASLSVRVAEFEVASAGESAGLIARPRTRLTEQALRLAEI